MTIVSVLVILAVCTALSLLVCLPVMLIVRWLRRRRPRPDAAAGTFRRRLAPHELPGLVAGLVVMFLGYAQAYLAPDTWFGRQMATDAGRIVFAIGLFLANAIGNAVVARWTARQARR